MLLRELRKQAASGMPFSFPHGNGGRVVPVMPAQEALEAEEEDVAVPAEEAEDSLEAGSLKPKDA